MKRSWSTSTSWTLLFNKVAARFFLGILTLILSRTSSAQFLEADLLSRSSLLKSANCEVSYYDLKAESLGALSSQMGKLGPIDYNGKRRDAFLKWHIWWTWPVDKAGDPDFERVRASYRATLYFPRWINIDDASQRDQKEWQRYITSLLKHEEQHVNNVLMHFKDTANAIASAARRDPNLTYKGANTVGREVLSKIRRLDAKLDQETNHGETQGARLVVVHEGERQNTVR
ncbi:MAG: DUF922 domain-containing protein [Bdellovibrionales bacterium]|nr:DUF922 domain-containing protein [Bdellovibrionales bacterium]